MKKVNSVFPCLMLLPVVALATWRTGLQFDAALLWSLAAFTAAMICAPYDKVQ